MNYEAHEKMTFANGESKAYRDNYDRIFGKKESEPAACESPCHCFFCCGCDEEAMVNERGG